MKHTRWLVALVVVLAACVKKGDDDLTAINKVRDNWAAAWKSGNAANLAALYDENALHAGNHEASMQGSIALASAYGGQFAQVTPTNLVLNSEKTEVGGDIAYDYGTFQYSVTPKNGGAPVSDSGRYLVVLKKQGDGTWKIVADMDNSATPLQAPQPAPAPAPVTPPAPTTTTTQ